MPAIYNKRSIMVPDNAVYIGRPSKWGNPFKVYPNMRGGLFAQQIAVMSYREYIKEHPELIEAARMELKGRDLVCWCAPLLCHADVLLRLANEGSK